MQPQTPSAKPAQTGPQIRKLQKGEVLFNEGDNSRAMYYVRTGMIRIFKKKGDTSIEIDTIRSGQVLGELAFLDGNPRSASGEALTDCELMEISGPTFQAVLVNMPDWLKMLLKTVVGRLRTASTRIRQLESASTAIDYSAKDGKRSNQYVYLSPIDVLKICSGILLVGARNGTAIGGGVDLRVGLLNRYVYQIMGIPTAKITTFLDILAQGNIVTMVNNEQGELDALLETGPEMLKPGGRMVVISFMSLEDRKVKEKFRTLAREGRATLLTRHPLQPGDQEVRDNPPSRSAKLRAVQML